MVMPKSRAREVLTEIRQERLLDTIPPESLSQELARHARAQRRADTERLALEALRYHRRNGNGGAP